MEKWNWLRVERKVSNQKHRWRVLQRIDRQQNPFRWKALMRRNQDLDNSCLQVNRKLLLQISVGSNKIIHSVVKTRPSNWFELLVNGDGLRFSVVRSEVVILRANGQDEWFLFPVQLYNRILLVMHTCAFSARPSGVGLKTFLSLSLLHPSQVFMVKGQQGHPNRICGMGFFSRSSYQIRVYR